MDVPLSSPILRTHNQGTYTFASLDLERGGTFGPITQAYETWGTLNEAKDNAVLVTPTLTADTFVHDEEEPEAVYKAWWNFIVGPDRPVDTTRLFVICPNVLGGCFGSTGPSSLDPLTQRPYGMDFPVITIRDIVQAQKRLIEALGITRLHTVIGGSFGGQQALEWAVTYPECVQNAVIVETTDALSAQAIAWNEIGRQAIKMDSSWQQGTYDPGDTPMAGMAVARMLALTTYLSEEILENRFGRDITMDTSVPTPSGTEDLGSRFEVESYLYYLGGVFSCSFDPNSYLYLSRAMDLYDVRGTSDSLESVLSRIRSKTLLVGSRSDILFPATRVRRLAETIRGCGGDATYRELDPPHGHYAFLHEQNQMQQILRDFLERQI